MHVQYKRGIYFSKLPHKSSLGILELQLPFKRGKHSCTQIKQTTPTPHPADLDYWGENELPNSKQKKKTKKQKPSQM